MRRLYFVMLLSLIMCAFGAAPIETAYGQCSNADGAACEGVEVVGGVSSDEVTVQSVTPISNPDPDYINSTTKIDISGLELWQFYGSITDGTQTVTFSSDMQKRGPVPNGWATWSSPPYSETAMPDVLFSNKDSMTWTLSEPAYIFGFELEPNRMFWMFVFKVSFYYEDTFVGDITRSVDGYRGARLFAAKSAPCGLPFDKVEITGQFPSPLGFGVAQVRYRSQPLSINVPVDIRPGSCPNPLSTREIGVLPIAIVGSATLDVTQIDPATVRLQGVAPLRSSLADVATPYEPYCGKVNALDCTAAGRDGFVDLVLHFNAQAVIAALRPVVDGDVRVLALTGNLKPEFGGMPIFGVDVVVIVPPGMPPR